MKRIAIFILTIVVMNGCVKSSEEQTAEKTLTGKLEIVNSWIRPAGKGMNTGAFFKIINKTAHADTLYQVEFSKANLSQIHKSFKTEDGRMGMEEVPYVVVESGSEFIFKPMSYHIMLIRLFEDLKVGEKHKLILHFKRAGAIELTAPVEAKGM